jgi:hypothetical protein
MPRLILFALLLALLSGCAAPALSNDEGPAPAPTVTLALSGDEGSTPFSTDTPQLSKTPSPTSTETATATEVPKPSGSENLPQGVNVVYDNESGIWGISMGNEVKAIPGAFFNSTGLHMTIDGKTVDISASELQKRTAYDQKLNLFSVYDDQGIISAEYDPGVGQPNTPDYIPGQGWVDMQDLANKACSKTAYCFIENPRGLPSGTVSVEFASTGIFRKTDAIDTQTNESVGKLLLLQFVTQNTAGKPTFGWMEVQTSDSQGGYINSFGGIIQMNNDKTLWSIEQWQQSLMPKGSLWTEGFLNNGYLQW